jgi:hydrogenase-4 component F
MIAAGATPGLVVTLPLLAAFAAALMPRPRVGAWLAVGGSAAAFASACMLRWQSGAGAPPEVDPLSVHFALLIAFLAATTAWGGRDHVNAVLGTGARARTYHALFLVLVAALLLSALSDRIGLGWFGLNAAMLAAAVAVGLAGTGPAVAAAIRLLLAGGIGMALALFGSVLIYLAARPVLGAGITAMGWHALADAAPVAPAQLLNLGFVLLLAGYGTLAAVAPLHLWLAAAMAEAPSPLAAMLSGALPVAALVPILRARSLLAANPAAMAPGPPLLAFGLISVLLGGFSLWRQREAMPRIACAGTAQRGVAVFAFGIGGVAATFAGVLHLTLLALATAAAVQCAIPTRRNEGAAQMKPALTRGAALVALAGLPPFGLFTSLFLIFAAAARQVPWLALPLGVGLAVSAAALAARLRLRDRCATVNVAALVPAWLHLALMLLFGLAMPGAVVIWFTDVARTLP